LQISFGVEFDGMGRAIERFLRFKHLNAILALIIIILRIAEMLGNAA
jgi:hypothetical protein